MHLFNESVLVLKHQRNGPEVSFVSLLNSFVTRHYGLSIKHMQISTKSLFGSVHGISLCHLSSKIASSHVGMVHNEHNFDGPMQKTHKVICF